jgi:hypothetical protein
VCDSKEKALDPSRGRDDGSVVGYGGGNTDEPALPIYFNTPKRKEDIISKKRLSN